MIKAFKDSHDGHYQLDIAEGEPLPDWVIGMTPCEPIVHDSQALMEATIRADRDTLLTACDWTQVADAPVDQAAWRAYRQALRDVPEQAGFPSNIDWPVAP